MPDTRQICKFLIIMAFILITACSGYLAATKPASGVYHQVKKGETLYKIAQIYHVGLQQIAEVNNIDNIEIVEAGRVLFIPDAQAVVEDVLGTVTVQEAEKNVANLPGKAPRKAVPKAENQGGAGRETSGINRSPSEKPVVDRDASELSSAAWSEALSRSDKTEFPLKLPPAGLSPGIKSGGAPTDGEQNVIQREKGLFLWPVAGKVVARYGIQPNNMFFNGIKISAPAGAFVTAAADGVVIFSAVLKDYGETVILKHDNDYASVYTQLGQRLVKRDDHPRKGDKIAILARPQGKAEAQLNFEIRYKNKARNPLFFLP